MSNLPDDLEVLGSARRVVVTKDATTIVDGAGDADAIADALIRFERSFGE